MKKLFEFERKESPKEEGGQKEQHPRLKIAIHATCFLGVEELWAQGFLNLAQCFFLVPSEMV